MNRKRFFVWVCLACLGPATLWADETIFSASGRQDPMDNIGGGVRAAAMGSAFVAVSDDSSAIYWNPAGLSNLRQSELSLQHSSWFGTGRESLLYGIPIPKVGGVGLSGSYMGYGSFDGRDSLGASTGSYSANQIDLGMGWGGRVAGILSLGAQIHGVQQTLDEKSYSLFTAGFGALVKTSGGWRMGASYMNGGISKGSVATAAAFRAGLSRNWTFKKGWDILAAASGNLSPQSGNSFQGGLEANYGGKYFIRVGYDQRLQKSGFDGLYGPTAGLGMSLGSLRLDYAFVPYGDLGNSHQFGLAYHFGTIIPEADERKSKAVPAQTSVVSPVPVTVFIAVPANPPVSAASVVPQTVNGSSGLGDGALVMNFEEAPEGLIAARSMAKDGRSVEAVKAYVDWIGKNPRDAQAWWELGVLYYRLGKKEYAVKCFESVLNLDPGNKNLADWLKKNKGR